MCALFENADHRSVGDWSDTMVVQRGLKILLVGGSAFLCALTTWGNLRDPATNYTFVRHVVSMDTISPDNVMATNAIQIPLVGSIAFWAIVAAEALY